MTVHSEFIDLRRQVLIHALLMRVKSDSLANGVFALETPHVEHHLEADLAWVLYP